MSYGEYKVRVDGIPAIAVVTHYQYQKPMGMWADSDIDCYGYEEMDFQLNDRKGYRAQWLEKIAEDKKLWEDIESQIKKQMQEEADDGGYHW